MATPQGVTTSFLFVLQLLSSNIYIRLQDTDSMSCSGRNYVSLRLKGKLRRTKRKRVCSGCYCRVVRYLTVSARQTGQEEAREIRDANDDGGKTDG